MRINQITCALLLVWIIAFISPDADCATLRVPTDYSTIQGAIDAAVDEDTVLVDPGTYVELIDFLSKEITVISSNGPEATVIDGHYGGAVVTINNCEEKQCKLEGFTIRNGYSSSGAAVQVHHSSAIIIDNIFESNSGNVIDVGYGWSPVIEKNIFRNNDCYDESNYGIIYAYNGGSPLVKNNVFINNDCVAINLIPFSCSNCNVQVVSNTIVGNSSGISIYNAACATPHLYKNNIIAGNKKGLEVQYGILPTSLFQNNLVYNNIENYSGVSDLTGTNGNFSADPKFLDESGNDFHLRTGSPAIDAGNSDSLTLPSDDMDGNPRILDGNGDGSAVLDIGAYEYNPAARPGISFHCDKVTGAAPLTVQFTSAVDGEPSEYYWDFGDGSSSTEANPIHSFAPGAYSVTLNAKVGAISVSTTRKDIIDSYTAYYLTTSAGYGGELWVMNGSVASSTIEAREGNSISLWIVPYQGYRIGEIIVDGQTVESTWTYSFNNIHENHSIIVNFIAVHTISTWAGPGGTISPFGEIEVDESSSYTFMIIPDESYRILKVYVDGKSVGAVSSYTFKDVRQAHEVKAYFVPSSFIVTRYSITDLGTLGGTTSHALGLNDSGLIVGYSDVSGDYYHHAFVYSGGVMTDLGTLGGQYSYATAINNLGHVIGSADFHAFLYRDGVMTDLGTLGGFHSFPSSINDSGQIVGSSDALYQATHAFQYADGVMTDLDASNYYLIYSQATGINKYGEIVGSFSGNPFFNSGPLDHAFLYSSGTRTNLGTLPGGSWSTASAINNSRQIVGTSATSDGQSHAFLYTDEQMVELNRIGEGSHAYDINDSGQIVGSYYTNYNTDEYNRAFLYSEGVIIDLNLVIPEESGWVLKYAYGINNKGQIIGWGLHDGVARGFLVEPSYEEVTHAIFASAPEHGSISPSGSIMIWEGANAVFNINPETGFFIKDVIVDGTSVGRVENYTFSTVLKDHTISATFGAITHNIAASASEYGSISPGGLIDVDSEQVFKISPNPKCHIKDVLVDGVSVGAVNSYSFTNITSDHHINALFEHDPVTVTTSAGENGSISPFGTVSVEYQQNQTFTIIPDANYHVTNVVVDGFSIGAANSYSFTNIKTNHTISATFERDPVTITATAGANGYISPSGSVSVEYGQSRDFYIAANAGYRIKDVLVDGQSVGPVSSYMFNNAVANHSIDASFLAVYNVSSSAGPGGTVTPSGNTKIDESGSLTFAIVPNANYGILNVYVDGVSMGPVSSCTFDNITKSHTVNAYFAENPSVSGTYSIIDLGTLGGSSSEAAAINNSGQVVGTSYTGYLDYQHAFLYSNGIMTDLGTLGGLISYASAINNSGQVVGKSSITGYFPRHAFIYSNGAMTDLGTFGGTDSNATDINDLGQIVGSYTSSYSVVHPFLYTDGVLTKLDTMGTYKGSTATAINNTSDVIGESIINSYGSTRTFLYSDDILTELPKFNGSSAIQPTSINDAGQIAGYGVASDGKGHALLYSNEAIIDLGTFGGWTIALSINVSGQVVGYYSEYYYPFLYSNGAATDLNTVLPQDSGWVLHKATAINDWGQIVGWGMHNGAKRAFLMTPTSDTITHTITASSTESGFILPSGSVAVKQGTNAEFSISAGAGSYVKDVLVDGVSVGPVGNYTFFTVFEDHTISVVTGPTITAGASEHGFILPSGSIGLSQGSSQVFTIAPDTHCHVADVLVDGNSVGAVDAYTFENIASDHTIYARFAIDEFNFTASAGTGGSISPSGSTQADALTSQTFIITPAEHFHVLDVLVDGASVGAVTSYQFDNVTADHAISVTFAIDQYTITASAGTHGSISPSGAAKIDHGSARSFTITPDAHYHVSDVLVDGTSVGAVSSYTFSNAAADHSISAVFAIDQHTITSSAGTYGSISPSGDLKVDYGSSKSLTITPNTGYCIKDLKVDGISVGAITSYQFDNVTDDHSISAEFQSSIVITSPRNGDSWLVGSRKEINWEYGIPASNVRIELLKAGSILKKLSAAAPPKTASTGSLEWRIPAGLAPGADYQIRITSTIDSAVSVTSPYFNIGMDTTGMVYLLLMD